MYTLHFDIKRLITRASLRAYSQTHAVSLKQHALHALHTRMRARTHELRLTRAYTQIPRTYARTLTLTRKCTHTGKRKLSVQLHVRWLQLVDEFHELSLDSLFHHGRAITWSEFEQRSKQVCSALEWGMCARDTHTSTDTDKHTHTHTHTHTVPHFHTQAHTCILMRTYGYVYNYVCVKCTRTHTQLHVAQFCA